jgi:hypothetical protein
MLGLLSLAARTEALRPLWLLIRTWVKAAVTIAGVLALDEWVKRW